MKLSAPKVGSNFKCPHCDVQFRVRISHAPTRDSGTAFCVGCRRKMSEWNDYEQPAFTPMGKGLQSEKWRLLTPSTVRVLKRQTDDRLQIRKRTGNLRFV